MCKHPKERVRYWTVKEPALTEKGIRIRDLLVGMCCECGEAMPEKIIKERKPA
jgi:hypothetical protein